MSAAPALRVTIAQLPVYAGDLAGNSARIVAAAAQAAAEHADLLITPEMSLSGYPVDDLLGEPDFTDAVRDELGRLAGLLPPDLLVAVGAPVWLPDLPAEHRRLLRDGNNPLDAVSRWVVNALVLFQHGRIAGYAIKSLLPTYGVFDDARWFLPAVAASPLVTANGVRVGLAICEDVWGSHVVDELVAAGAEVIVSANASPYAEGKQGQRESMLRAHSLVHPGIPLVYCNTVGGQDEVVYDGGSFVVDGAGSVTARMPTFAPATATVDIPVAGARAQDREPLAPPLAALRSSTEDTYAALVTGLRDYVTRSGADGLIIGLSGGLDSALAAVIAVDALGADAVLGVGMPGPYSSPGSVTDAQELAANLGIAMHLLPITDGYATEKAALGDLLASGTGRAIADENIQARLRALHLMTLANAQNRIVLNTGNKSEASVGYFTLGGDSSGGFAVLKDVYKTRAYELAAWRNAQAQARGEVPPIPTATITKPPSAELAPGQEDINSLPPYPVLDAILRMHLEERQGRGEIARAVSEQFDVDGQPLVARVLAMVARSEHKRRQVAPGVKITERAYGRDRRVPIINAFAP